MFGLLGVAALIALLVPIYWRDKRAARPRYQEFSQVIQTPAGPLEYATFGEGYPVIILHGMGGGYDQGLLLGQLLDPTQYRIIAPSRPGHRGTPLATGATFEALADALAYLLDALNLERVAIVALSGGGFGALQFALRHPARCQALVLLSAHGPGTYRFIPPRGLLWLLEGMVALEFLQWLVALKLPAQVIIGLEGSDLRRLRDPQNLALGTAFLQGFFPAAAWKTGTFNDIRLLFELGGKPDWPLAQITVPTLVLHGERDLMVRVASARFHAQQIPGARLMTFVDGTHMAFVTHRPEISAALAQFLQSSRG